MYGVEEVEGRGRGCVATKRIKPGTLVLKEKPQLLLAPSLQFSLHSLEDFAASISLLTEAFVIMSEEDKSDFLDLANMFSVDHSQWSNCAVKFMNLLKQCPKTNKDIGFAAVEQIAQIYKTNAFPNGVCLNMSMFNHSCR